MSEKGAVIMIKAGIFVFPRVEELDFVGPFETLSAANILVPGSMEVKLLAREEGPIEGANGLRFLPSGNLGEGALDLLILPGGSGRRAAMEDRKVLSFIQNQYEGLRFLGTVCTGAFLAAKAGLLKNRRATTHHLYFEELDSFPGVKVVEHRVVKDGNILTAGGVSSGIDLSLWLLALLFDPDFAHKASEYIEYPFRPDQYREF